MLLRGSELKLAIALMILAFLLDHQASSRMTPPTKPQKVTKDIMMASFSFKSTNKSN